MWKISENAESFVFGHCVCSLLDFSDYLLPWTMFTIAITKFYFSSHNLKYTDNYYGSGGFYSKFQQQKTKRVHWFVRNKWDKTVYYKNGFLSNLLVPPPLVLNTFSTKLSPMWRWRCSIVWRWSMYNNFHKQLHVWTLVYNETLAAIYIVCSSISSLWYLLEISLYKSSIFQSLIHLNDL